MNPDELLENVPLPYKLASMNPQSLVSSRNLIKFLYPQAQKTSLMSAGVCLDTLLFTKNLFVS